MANVTPVHLLTTSRGELLIHLDAKHLLILPCLVLVHPQGANQPKHVQGVPNSEGVYSAQFFSSAAPLPQGRHARGADERVRFTYDIPRHLLNLLSPGARVLRCTPNVASLEFPTYFLMFFSGTTRSHPRLRWTLSIWSSRTCSTLL